MAVSSNMLDLGTPAPDLDLPDPAGARHGLADAEGSPVLVAFLCNHCPYVVHVADALGEVTNELADLGIATFGVMSNDWTTHPDDAPEHMGAFALAHRWSFPYLVDEDQSVARAYRAACTPDFFLFDADHRLAYRGQMDASRPGGSEPSDGADLLAAARAVAAGEPTDELQRPSMGCSIKWRPGNEPA